MLLCLVEMFYDKSFGVYVDIDGEKSVIHDPYSSRGVLSYERIVKDSKFCPLALFKTTKGFLLFWLDLNDTQKVIAWELDLNCRYLCQSKYNVSFLLSLLESQPSEGIQKQLKKTVPHFFLEKLNISLESIRWDGHKFILPKVRYIQKNTKIIPMQDIDSERLRGTLYDSVYEYLRFWHHTENNNFVSEKPADLRALFEDAHDFISSSRFDQFWLRACDSGSWKHAIKSSLIVSYVALKYGVYIALNPISKKVCCSKISQFRAKDVAGHIFIYYDDDNSPFVEIRGGGFLGVLRALYFPVLDILITFSDNLNWGDSNYMLNSLADFIGDIEGKPLSCFGDKINLVTYLGHNNLGHCLWNELNGIHEANGFLSAENNVNLEVYEYASGNGFGSKLSESLPVEDLWNSGSINYTRQDKGQEFISEIGLNVFYKDIFMRKDYITNLVKGFDSMVSSGSTFDLTHAGLRVFVNIRTHNKSLMNISECINLLCEKLIHYDAEAKSKVEFVFEGAGAKAVYEDIKLIMSDYKSTYYDKLPVGDLWFLLKSCDYIIAPIGSALVLPTWLLNKPSYVHGDHKHINQMMFWSYISEVISEDSIKCVPKNFVFQETEEFYENYTIEPEVFSSEVLQHMIYSGVLSINS